MRASVCPWSRLHILMGLRLLRGDLSLGNLLFSTVAVPFVFGLRVTRRILFLGCRVPTRERSPGVPLLAAFRIFVATLSGNVERFSVNSCVTFVSVPAACPSLRATVFRKGSCFTGCFFAAIGFLAGVPASICLPACGHLARARTKSRLGRDFPTDR